MKPHIVIIAALAASPALAQESPEALADAFCAAISAKDAAAIGALYTEDADFYDVDGTVKKGPAAIVEGWSAFFAGIDSVSCKIDLKGQNATKKDATSWGLWSMTATPAEGEPVAMTGRYMDYSVKTKDGWRYRADHASMSAPAAASDE